MFRGSLDDLPLYDVAAALEAIAQNDIPVPDEVANATRLVVPAGPMPARGWVLMLLSDLQQLGLNDTHQLHFEFEWEDGSKEALDFYSLVLTREPVCVTPSYRAPSDPDSLYLLELSDMRWQVDNPYFCQVLNAQYNVRAPAYVGAEAFNDAQRA